NHATQDLYESIENGDYPEWELNVQIMTDDEHTELDFDPLDDTKIWPSDQFPWFPIGKMTLNRNPENFVAEVEQGAFGTGVLVDRLDFSADKMLQGRTLSYSGTHRYRVGTNYLQLPIITPKNQVATNQRDGHMTHYVHGITESNPHINYEPSGLNGIVEAKKEFPDHEPYYAAKLVRKAIDRTNVFAQAGERYRSFEPWERDDLIANLAGGLRQTNIEIQRKMIDLLAQC